MNEEYKIVTDAVIPVYGPDEKLLQLLKMLQTQSTPIRRVHLIVTEKPVWKSFISKYRLTQELFARRFPETDVTFITKEQFDHGSARNKGVYMSEDAQFVLLMTQDAVPANTELVTNLLLPFSEDPLLEAAYARQLPSADASLAEKYTRAFNYPDEPMTKSQADFERLGIKTYFCSNVCAMYRRELLAENGFFPEHMIFNEDMVQAGKALQRGLHTRYSPEAEVIHSHDYTAKQQLKRNFDLGVSQADHPEIFAGASSEGEGVRYVKSVAAFLLKNGAVFEIPVFIFRCGSRFIGYRLGKNYRKLPRRLVLKMTGSPYFWEQKQDVPDQTDGQNKG